jgi:gamma-glutamylcyclotransferase (GGCT)/AIG2-like uncharacterized protein YtfP
MKTRKVAVYGSLKSGYGNHRVMGPSEFACNAYIEIASLDGGGFPIMKLGNTYKLHVEIYDVPESHLPYIDALEGYHEGREATFYDRKTVQATRFEDGETVDVLVYEYVANVEDNTIDKTDELTACEVCMGVRSW